MTNTRAARRFRLALPILLAELPQKTHTIEGTTRNISTNGVFFTTKLRMTNGANLEFKFTLPPDESQQNPATVSGRARVVRVEQPKSGSDEVGVAVAIEEFRIIRDVSPAV
jgi:hypothetical protein